MIRKVVVLFFFLFLFTACASKKRKVCNDLFVEGEKINFTDSEQKLICGDSENPAWNSIPRPQVIFHLKAFLLERGYFNPAVKEEPTSVLVTLGPRVDIEKFVIHDWPTDLKSFHERRYKGLPMMPSSLDEIEAGAALQLKGMGYPCAEIKSEAFPFEKTVHLYVTSGARQLFPEPVTLPVEEIDARTLRRFEAFTAGELYDSKLLELTERRIRNSGLVQDASYYPECNRNEDFSIRHKTIVGKSRFFSIGAGFDTEQLAIAKAKISLNRLTQKGSSLESEAFGSFRVQSLTNSAKFHLWPPESRSHLYSDFIIEHKNEKQYDTLTLSAGAGVGSSLEMKRSKLDVRFGPKGEYIKLYRGVGPDETRNIALEFSVFLTSHRFEYFVNSPQEGYRLGLNVESTSRSLGSTFSATRYKLSAEALWNLYDNHALDLIWGVRSFLSSTHSHDGKDRAVEVPPSFKNYLGGSRDLRGFGREALPNGGSGAMSAAYLGTELRFARFGFLEPLLFADVGALADDSLSFEEPYYVSPGVGLRWPLSFGTLRGTAAYGWTVGGSAENEKSDPQFFLSFGEEF